MSETNAVAGGAALYVARQPILDGHGQVFGYELLYRDGADSLTCTISTEQAGARVLADAVMGIGFDTLTDGRPAFLNMTRSLLTSEGIRRLPRSAVVLELLETIAVDDEIVAACRDLRAAGYALALDDFAPGSDAERLLPHVRFVKVDVLATPLATLRPLAHRLTSAGIRLVAEKVETRDVFQATRDAGYGLFQGYYFCRPTLRPTTTLPAGHLAALRLLSALSSPDLTIHVLEDLIKRDVTLSYRVLRSVNSAAFGIRREITSMRLALVLLGIGPIRSWAAIWCLAQLNMTGVLEVVTLAAVRGRCCELMASRLMPAEQGGMLFLVGMCSLLDTMLGRPMDEAIAGLPLPRDAIDALLGVPNQARGILDAAIAYERGTAREAAAAAAAIGLSSRALGEAYTGALQWAHAFARVA